MALQVSTGATFPWRAVADLGLQVVLAGLDLVASTPGERRLRWVFLPTQCGKNSLDGVNRRPGRALVPPTQIQPNRWIRISDGRCGPPMDMSHRTRNPTAEARIRNRKDALRTVNTGRCPVRVHELGPPASRKGLALTFGHPARASLPALYRLLHHATVRRIESTTCTATAGHSSIPLGPPERPT